MVNARDIFLDAIRICKNILNMDNSNELSHFHFDNFMQDFAFMIDKNVDILNEDDKTIIRKWYVNNSRKKDLEFYEYFPIMIFTKDEIKNILLKTEYGMGIFIKRGLKKFPKKFLEIYEDVFLNHRKKIRSLLIRSLLVKIIVFNSSKDFICDNMQRIKNELKDCSSKDSKSFYEKVLFDMGRLKTGILIQLGKLPIFRWFIDVRNLTINFVLQGLSRSISLAGDMWKEENIEVVLEELKKIDCDEKGKLI